MAEAAAREIPLRVRYAAYMAGFFSLGLVPMMTVAVPLWTLEIGAAPWLIGVALGARAALSVLFSIHGGALIDRLGTTRVMVGCSAVAAVLLPLYPLFPNIGYLILLQLIVGFVQGLAWMSAQTQIGLLSGGEPTFIGRFTFVSTLGNAAGPLAVGIAWDGWGPHGAFGVLGLWAAGALVSVLVLPRGFTAVRTQPARFTVRDALPRLRDYAAAFRMVKVPIIGFVVAGSFLMTCNHAMRQSFYPIYLESIEMPGTLIGVLFALGSLASSVAGLSIGPATRRVDPNRLLLFAVGAAAVALAVTPWFSNFGVLVALICVWGLSGGLAFPTILMVLARTVPDAEQGMSIGIRTTVNRFAGFIVPLLMGVIVEVAGLLTGFLITGGAILTALVGLAVWWSPTGRR